MQFSGVGRAFGPAVGRNRGAAASPLLTNLIDWWDSGDLTGQHAGGTLSLTDHILAADPFGGTTAWYAGDATDTPANQTFRPTPATLIDRNAAYTLAAVVYRIGSGQIEIGRGLTEVGPMFYLRASDVGYRFWNGSSSFPTGGSHASSGWTSFVVTFDGATTLTFWVDGAIAWSVTVPASSNPANEAALVYFFRSGIDFRLAVAAQAARAWTPSDVALFHNSGSFVRYADL